MLDWLEGRRVAYFDQLVAEARQEWLSARLAYLHLLSVFERHDAVLATTVMEPIENRAALPYLEATGFLTLGAIDEHYPEIGDLRSRIHVLTKKRFEEVRRSPLARRFERRLLLEEA